MFEFHSLSFTSHVITNIFIRVWSDKKLFYFSVWRVKLMIVKRYYLILSVRFTEHHNMQLCDPTVMLILSLTHNALLSAVFMQVCARWRGTFCVRCVYANVCLSVHTSFITSVGSVCVCVCGAEVCLYIQVCVWRVGSHMCIGTCSEIRVWTCARALVRAHVHSAQWGWSSRLVPTVGSLPLGGRDWGLPDEMLPD